MISLKALQAVKGFQWAFAIGSTLMAAGMGLEVSGHGFSVAEGMHRYAMGFGFMIVIAGIVMLERNKSRVERLKLADQALRKELAKKGHADAGTVLNYRDED